MCITKFNNEHTSKVTAMKFAKPGVLISCSLDGTVRAFDTIRFKQFRVMQPEIPNQLYSLDNEGEIICAGGFDPYEIYCFSLQNGQLLEVISGHEGPVTMVKLTQHDEQLKLMYHLAI